MSEETKYTFELIQEHIRVCEQRFQGINIASDFTATTQGQLILDAICMRLQTLSDLVKRHVKHNPEFPFKYPEIDWVRIIRFRDFISHHYEELDFEVIFGICKFELNRLKVVCDKEIAS